MGAITVIGPLPAIVNYNWQTEGPTDSREIYTPFKAHSGIVVA